MGVEYRLAAGTGAGSNYKRWKTGEKHHLLRCDMDALPVKEDTDNLIQPKACVSQKPGVCHACGHDAHMAMMLTTIKVLSQVREQLKGTVYCCFEEGEEALDGYQHVLELVSEYPIDDCFALHVYNDMPAGKINLVSGPRMAGAVCFGVHVIGKADMVPDRIWQRIL